MALNKMLKVIFIIILTIIINPTVENSLRCNTLKSLINIKDINYDCVPDTLIGTFENSTLKLNYILWGIDSTIQAFPKDYNWVDTTFIHYPEWMKIRSYINISSFNIDTIPDIMILIKGKIEIDSNLVDTSLKVIIYGQYGFDSVSSITLTNINYPVQDIPFKSKYVISNQDLSNCQIREYDFTKVSDFTKSITNYPPPIFKNNNAKSYDTTNVVLLYPNPSQNSIIVKTENFDPGRYIVDIVTINGDFLLQKIINIDSNSDEHFFNVSKLTNGTYYFVISNNNKIIKTVKFIKNI